jgi:starvation-inducible DNA-binding protein
VSIRTNITRINPTRNDMPAEVRQKAITLLNQQLADTLDLYSQTKQAHWNVKGENFIAVHEFFDDLAESVEEFIDNIAERATALGGFALGTTRMAAAATRLAEYPTDLVDSKKHLEALAERYAVVCSTTRKAIETSDEFGDADTADLFTGISREMDKQLWMIESHLPA